MVKAILQTFLPKSGRRKCLGETVVKVETFLFFANLMKDFTISSADGTVMTEELKFADGLGIGPENFTDIKAEPRGF